MTEIKLTTNVDDFYMAMMIIIVHVVSMNPDRTWYRASRSNGHTSRIILVEFYKQQQQLSLIGSNLSSAKTTYPSLSKC